VVWAGPRLADPQTLDRAGNILQDIQQHGEDALREHAEHFGELESGEPFVRTHEELADALGAIPRDTRDILEQASNRITAFAKAQRQCLQDLETDVPGGVAGHRFVPVERVGCYAPGGRYPLPSSVLMTAITARVAGVETVVVASPRPSPVTLAAAALAEADVVLAVGGIQAIAAMTFGVGQLPTCDMVVGPGNRWVTAAKQLVNGVVAIDMLAGPSELVLLTDQWADPALVAADLIAQAEHDIEALPVLVVTDEGLIERVETELERQLKGLSTAGVARASLATGFAVAAASDEDAVAICNRLAPEHLALHVLEPALWTGKFRHYGALFEGASSAEAFGDYGLGPNHVLPTGGTARMRGGLSVLTFLRMRTWLRLEPPRFRADLVRQVAGFARLEGLEGHARSMEMRLTSAAQL